MTSTKDWVKGYGRAAAEYGITESKYSDHGTADLGITQHSDKKTTRNIEHPNKNPEHRTPKLL
jgi:hypothetical protein